MKPRTQLPALLLLASAHLATAPALAGPSSSATPSAGGAVVIPPVQDLPPLPQLAPLKKPEIDAEAQKELEKLLARLTSEKADIRERAAADILKVDAAYVGAIHARIQGIRESLDRDRAPRILADARKKVRDARKNDKSAAEADDDWLTFVLADPQPESDAWKELVELLAMVRMLGAIGTTPAVRPLVELRGQFGDLLRIDLSRQIDKLRDKAVPALIEAKKNDAEVVRRFAENELDKLGRGIPGEAVASSDPEILADVLRAFGRIRDVDAVRVTLSFANHERQKVRLAARETIAAIGEPGRWQLREAFEDLTGEKPDKSVAWDLMARQIFALYDKARLAEFESLFARGVDAQKAGKDADAVAIFDQVLARDPLYDKRATMVASYVAVAKAVPEDDKRLALFRKALRLDPQNKEKGALESLIALTEAKLLIADGRPDRFLLERAVELDASNTEARDLMKQFDEKVVAERPAWPRYAVAGGIFAGMLALLGLISWFFRKKPTLPPAGPSQGPPSAAPPGGGASGDPSGAASAVG